MALVSNWYQRAREMPTDKEWNMSKIRVTEEIGLNRSTVVNKWDVAEAIGPWFPEAPEDVVAAIADLQRKLDRGGDTVGLEQYLGIMLTTYDG